MTDLGTLLSPFPGRHLRLRASGGGGESAILASRPFRANSADRAASAGRVVPRRSADRRDRGSDRPSVRGRHRYGILRGRGHSLASPMFAAMWVLADEAAGESLGQAAPALAAMSPSAFRDIVPVDAGKISTSGSIRFQGKTTTKYDPAQVLGLEQTQPDGFVGTSSWPGDQGSRCRSYWHIKSLASVPILRCRRPRAGTMPPASAFPTGRAS